MVDRDGIVVLLKSSEEVVASPDIIFSLDYRDIADPGGRIGRCSSDIHAVLSGRSIRCDGGFFGEFF